MPPQQITSGEPEGAGSPARSSLRARVRAEKMDRAVPQSWRSKAKKRGGGGWTGCCGGLICQGRPRAPLLASRFPLYLLAPLLPLVFESKTRGQHSSIRSSRGPCAPSSAPDVMSYGRTLGHAQWPGVDMTTWWSHASGQGNSKERFYTYPSAPLCTQPRARSSDVKLASKCRCRHPCTSS